MSAGAMPTKEALFVAERFVEQNGNDVHNCALAIDDLVARKVAEERGYTSDEEGEKLRSHDDECASHFQEERREEARRAADAYEERRQENDDNNNTEGELK